MQEETQVASLGREDPLEEVMATRSSILAGKILWAEEPGGLQSVGSQSQTWQYTCTQCVPRQVMLKVQTCVSSAKGQVLRDF